MAGRGVRVIVFRWEGTMGWGPEGPHP
jgi:hypothetical protein